MSLLINLYEKLDSVNRSEQGIAYYVNKLHFAPGWYLLIHLLVLAIFVVRFFMLKKNAEKREMNKTQTGFMLLLKSNLENLMEKAKSNQAKEIVQKLYAVVCDSDSMKDDALKASEQRIASAFVRFSNAVEEDSESQIRKEGETLLLTIEERNRKCKALQ